MVSLFSTITSIGKVSNCQRSLFRKLFDLQLWFARIENVFRFFFLGHFDYLDNSKSCEFNSSEFRSRRGIRFLAIFNWRRSRDPKTIRILKRETDFMDVTFILKRRFSFENSSWLRVSFRVQALLEAEKQLRKAGLNPRSESFISKFLAKFSIRHMAIIRYRL